MADRGLVRRARAFHHRGTVANGAFSTRWPDFGRREGYSDCSAYRGRPHCTMLLKWGPRVTDRATDMAGATAPYWSVPADRVAARLESGPTGLSSAAAEQRLERYGLNELRARQALSRGRVFLNQVRSPLLLLLVFAALASGVTGEWVDAGIILTIVLV